MATNFGLYGVEVLARELADGAPCTAADLGAPGRRCSATRPSTAAVTVPIYLGTNAIVSLFTDERTPAKLPCASAVLTVAERVPPFSAAWCMRAITRQLTGEAALA